jgi:hypothetical protein
MSSIQLNSLIQNVTCLLYPTNSIPSCPIINSKYILNRNLQPKTKESNINPMQIKSSSHNEYQSITNLRRRITQSNHKRSKRQHIIDLHPETRPNNNHLQIVHLFNLPSRLPPKLLLPSNRKSNLLLHADLQRRLTRTIPHLWPPIQHPQHTNTSQPRLLL